MNLARMHGEFLRKPSALWSNLAFLLACCCAAALLCSRADFFSPVLVSGPLLPGVCEDPGEEARKALSQSYHYLGQGRQAFAFASADGRWVIKFFNHKYFRIPFYGAWLHSEQKKRRQRKQFYLESYQIAASQLKEETGVCYLHMSRSTERLPQIELIDSRGRSCKLDLHRFPFVLQKMGKPFYPSISLYGMEKTIRQFLALLAARIDKKISDADHDVEHNFGFCEGKVIHLDPGRLSKEEGLWEPERLKQELWRATHRFRRWIADADPERVPFFDRELESHRLRILQHRQSCE